MYPIYALRPDDYQAEYNARLANVSLQEFLKILPEGEETYFEGIRRMYTYLYEVVQYEKLLANPEAEISQLCQKLELEFIPSMINYGENNHPKWRFGDPKNLYENTKPNPQHSDHWKSSLKDPQVWGSCVFGMLKY